jgi:hypothetical protein
VLREFGIQHTQDNLPGTVGVKQATSAIAGERDEMREELGIVDTRARHGCEFDTARSVLQ